MGLQYLFFFAEKTQNNLTPSPNEVLIYNNGRLPESWTEADLFARHTSIPHNPLIAGAFFRSGQIGITPRGIQKNIDELKKVGIVERVGAAKGGY